MAAMAESSATGLPVTTAFELPGMTVERDLGVAFGLIVRGMVFCEVGRRWVQGTAAGRGDWPG